jgi:AraC-like DNA-binding protein
MLNLYQALKGFPPFSRQLTCKGMLFTNYDCPQEERKASVYMEQNVILYVIRGRRVYHRQQQSWEMKEGRCAFVKNGGFISEKPGREEWCVMAFFIPDEFLRQLRLDNQNSLIASNLVLDDAEPMLMLEVSEITKACFFSMLPYFTQSPAPPENLIELKFKELVLSLLANPSNLSFLSHVHALENRSRISVEQVMQNNFSYNLRLTDLAKLSCLSVSTFKREFKKRFNETPARWVMKKRLNMAKELLKNTELSISEISSECGFENPAHFSRVFKEKAGDTPIRFRQANRVCLPGLPT